MASTNKKREEKGLTDEQLIAKYDNGKPVSFDEAIKKAIKTSSHNTKDKRP